MGEITDLSLTASVIMLGLALLITIFALALYRDYRQPMDICLTLIPLSLWLLLGHSFLAQLLLWLEPPLMYLGFCLFAWASLHLAARMFAPFRTHCPWREIAIAESAIAVIFGVITYYYPQAHPHLVAILLIAHAGALLWMLRISVIPWHRGKLSVLAASFALCLSAIGNIVLNLDGESVWLFVVQATSYMVFVLAILFVRFNVAFAAYRELETLTEDLKVVRQTLFASDALNVVSRLGAGLTHGLGSPALIINAICDWQDRHPKTPLDKEMVQNLRAASNQMTNVKKIFRELSEPTGYHSPSQFSLKEIMDHTAGLVAHSLSGIGLEVLFHKDDLHVWAREGHMRHILLNLFAFSIQRLGDFDQNTPALIKIDVSSNASQVVIDWSDNGKPVDRHCWGDMPTIDLDALSQTDQPVLHGLQVAYHLARQNNGWMTFPLQPSHRGNVIRLAMPQASSDNF